MFKGSLEDIFIGEAAQDLKSVAEVRAVAGKGLEGDRYFDQSGTYSEGEQTGPDQQVTLIEAEVIESLRRNTATKIDPVQSRRNLLTRGVPLNHLVGHDFWVGEVKMRGIDLCEPCDHLAKLTNPKVMKALIHRGGLRAQVLSDGVIKTGDVIKVADSE